MIKWQNSRNKKTCNNWKAHRPDVGACKHVQELVESEWFAIQTHVFFSRRLPATKTLLVLHQSQSHFRGIEPQLGFTVWIFFPAQCLAEIPTVFYFSLLLKEYGIYMNSWPFTHWMRFTHSVCSVGSVLVVWPTVHTQHLRSNSISRSFAKGTAPTTQNARMAETTRLINALYGLTRMCTRLKFAKILQISIEHRLLAPKFLHSCRPLGSKKWKNYAMSCVGVTRGRLACQAEPRSLSRHARTC